VDEATALLLTLACTPADAPTACRGWTAHDLVAHLAAGAAEMAGHAERALTGQKAEPTASFARREAPFVALEDEELRGRLVSEALRLNAATEALARSGASAEFSGRRMTATDIEMHGRAEAALHRWDLAGDDDVGQDLLAAPELTEHAVTALNTLVSGSAELPATRARAAGLEGGNVRVAFGASGQRDVVLVVDGGGARLEWADAGSAPTVTADAATRLLALWGRRSPDRALVWHADDDTARRFEAFLWAPAKASP
jgi:uncharacterized protein (TIGR03083 family)